jgi:predicted TIM-barrel fold metal-dependent hydrolase
MPSWIQRSIAAMIFGGVFERHPDLIVLSVESDIGWIGNFLERMDHAFGRFRFLQGTGGVSADRLPSDYFHRNVRATFMRDKTGLATRHQIGLGNILWSSDYPHADSTWPESQKVIAEQFAGVPEGEKRRILSENAAALYGFSLS